MNDLVPYKPLTYKDQLDTLEKRYDEYMSRKVVPLYVEDAETKVRHSPLKKFRELRETLRDRISKQEKGEV